MENTLSYKGYFANVEYIAEDKILFGKIEGISDLVTFESTNAEKIEQEFQSAVDDYLAFCKEVGKSPEKAYKGSFNVRIDPNLHKNAALYAIRNGQSLNQIVEKAIDKYLSNEETSNADLARKIDLIDSKITPTFVTWDANALTGSISNIFSID